MSTGTKRRLDAAIEDAIALRHLFEGSYERWEFAGSVRRERAFVTDVEHVVMPRMGEVRRPGMLLAEPGSLLWARCEELLAAGTIAKAEYASGHKTEVVDRKTGEVVPSVGPSWTVTNRWGEKYRGLRFRGFTHEIFTADANNWGAQLCIRTGPAKFSEHVVTQLKQGGRFRQVDGYLRRVGGPNAGEIVEVVDDLVYLRWAGVPELPPKEREPWWLERNAGARR